MRHNGQSQHTHDESGFSVPELIVTIIVFAIVSVAIATTLIAYINSASLSRLRASALSVATQQMEYLRSLPYDGLAVAGGSIATSGTPIPATITVSRSSRSFDVETDIRYADDAYDGCLNYGASQALLCRNYTATTVLSDVNPKDYKLATVTVKEKTTGKVYSTLSTQFTSRVAEVAGNSSAILVTVLDGSGSPVGGALVRIRNTTLSPQVNQTATTDSNGIALFLDVPVDTGKDYVVSSTKSGYSNATTIAQSGSLIPQYPNVSGIAQQVSNVTLKSEQISTNSLEIKLVDTSGAALPGVSIGVKGGIKLYTNPSDTTYSQLFTVTSDATGYVHLGSLVPGDYQVCFLAQPSPCSASSSYKALAVNVAYGANSFQPFEIPAGTSAADGGPMQRIVVVMSTSTTMPRITDVQPSLFSSTATDAATSLVTINGANLSGATVQLRQGTTTLTGTVSGSDTSAQIAREFNLSGVAAGAYELIVTTGVGTVIQTGVAPGTLGGVNVTP